MCLAHWRISRMASMLMSGKALLHANSDRHIMPSWKESMDNAKYISNIWSTVRAHKESVRISALTCHRFNVCKLYLLIYVYVCICMYTYVFVCIRMYLYVYVCICIHMYLYVYVCICIHNYVFVCIRMYNFDTNWCKTGLHTMTTSCFKCYRLPCCSFEHTHTS